MWVVAKIKIKNLNTFKKDLIECNNILKLIKERYGSDIDWRGNIEDGFEELII